jgi:type I restriction enzyme S subunit
MGIKSKITQSEIGPIPSDWTVDKLKQFWTVVDCKHITAKFAEYGYPLASITECQSLYVNFKKAMYTSEFYYKKLIEGGRKPTNGDLIFSRNATVGEVAQVLETHPLFAMGQDVCLLKKKKAEYSTWFFQAIIKSFIIRNQLDSLMVGSTFKRVNIEQIRNFLVPFPSSSEQELIGNVIEDFEKAITTIQLLINKKSAILASITHNLISGKIRLRGFRKPYKKLLIKKLEKEGKIILNRGNVISKKDIEAKPGDNPIYSSSVIEEGLLGKYADFMFDEQLISWSIDGGGNFFYRPKHKFSLTNVSGYLKVDESVFNYEYLAFQLKYLHKSLQFDYTRKAHPSVIRELYEISIPEMEEQEEIAKILNEMSGEVKMLREKLSKYSLIKQGVMQKLLTGKIRLI